MGLDTKVDRSLVNGNLRSGGEGATRTLEQTVHQRKNELERNPNRTPEESQQLQWLKDLMSPRAGAPNNLVDRLRWYVETPELARVDTDSELYAFMSDLNDTAEQLVSTRLGDARGLERFANREADLRMLSRGDQNAQMGRDALQRYHDVCASISRIEKASGGVMEKIEAVVDGTFSIESPKRYAEGRSAALDSLREEKAKLESYGVRPSRGEEAIGVSIRQAIEGGEQDEEWAAYVKSFATPSSAGPMNDPAMFESGNLDSMVVTRGETDTLVLDRVSGDREGAVGKKLIAKQSELEQKKKDLESQLYSGPPNSDELRTELADTNTALNSIKDIRNAASEEDGRFDWMGGGANSESMVGRFALERLNAAQGPERAFLEELVGVVDTELGLKVDPCAFKPSEADVAAAATETQRLTIQGSKAVNRMRECESMLRELEAFGFKDNENGLKLQEELEVLRGAGIRTDMPAAEAGIKLDQRADVIKDQIENGDFLGLRNHFEGDRERSGDAGKKGMGLISPFYKDDLKEREAYLRSFAPTPEETRNGAASFGSDDVCADDPSSIDNGFPGYHTPSGLDRVPTDAGSPPVDNATQIARERQDVAKALVNGGAVAAGTAGIPGASTTCTPGASYVIPAGTTLWEIAGQLRAQGVKGTQREVIGKIVEMNQAKIHDPNLIFAGDSIRLPLAEGAGSNGAASMNTDGTSNTVSPGATYKIPRGGAVLTDIAKELQTKGVQGPTELIMDLIIHLNRGQQLLPGAVIKLPDAATQEQMKAVPARSFLPISG